MLAVKDTEDQQCRSAGPDTLGRIRYRQGVKYYSRINGGSTHFNGTQYTFSSMVTDSYNLECPRRPSASHWHWIWSLAMDLWRFDVTMDT